MNNDLFDWSIPNEDDQVQSFVSRYAIAQHEAAQQLIKKLPSNTWFEATIFESSNQDFVVDAFQQVLQECNGIPARTKTFWQLQIAYKVLGELRTHVRFRYKCKPQTDGHYYYAPTHQLAELDAALVRGQLGDTCIEFNKTYLWQRDRTLGDITPLYNTIIKTAMTIAQQVIEIALSDTSTGTYPYELDIVAYDMSVDDFLS